jgi:hypothetical protein
MNNLGQTQFFAAQNLWQRRRQTGSRRIAAGSWKAPQNKEGHAIGESKNRAAVRAGNIAAAVPVARGVYKAVSRIAHGYAGRANRKPLGLRFFRRRRELWRIRYYRVGTKFNMFFGDLLKMTKLIRIYFN